MSDLLVIVPSRGRPQNIKSLVKSWQRTDTQAHLLVAVDSDDPARNGYLTDVKAGDANVRLYIGERLRLGGTLNSVSTRFAKDYKYIGFMGDDHRPRTRNWDAYVTDALGELGTGIVYGNDLVWGEKLPTAAFMTSDIVQKLGYMVPPGMIHMYLDNFWLELGKKLGKLKYLPEVTIEHMHPSVGKSNMDASYEETNASQVFDHDRDLFEKYCENQLALDVQKLV